MGLEIRQLRNRDGGEALNGSVGVQPGIVGICEVAREAYPDSTALDPNSKKHDPKSTAEDPRWYMVDVKLVRPLLHISACCKRMVTCLVPALVRTYMSV